MPVDRRKLAIGGLVLAGVLFVSLNTFSALSLRGQQLDLTQARQYTLSQGTTKLLAELPEPVTLRLYVSKTVRDTNPFLASYATRVRDLLQTYAQRSDGKLKVEYIDPEPFSQAEDRAVGFGLQPITLDNGGTTGYFGIAGTNSTDDVDAIPVLSPDREQFLEYDLTRLVYNLANPQKPEVAMISGLPVNGDPASQYQPWKIYTELGQFYDIHYMDGDITSFDKNTKLLVIIFPQKLSDKTLYAIDQFVLHGGKAMVFVDPQSEAAAMRQRQQMPGPMASDLEPLFKAWGVEMVPAKVVGDPQYARQVQFPNGGQTQIVDYLPWLSLDQSAFADDPTVAQLNRINVETAGILEPLEGCDDDLHAASPFEQAGPGDPGRQGRDVSRPAVAAAGLQARRQGARDGGAHHRPGQVGLRRRAAQGGRGGQGQAHPVQGAHRGRGRGRHRHAGQPQLAREPGGLRPETWRSRSPTMRASSPTRSTI